jgi:uncharacterized protein (DUF1501 family)
VLAGGALSWRSLVSLHAEEVRRRGRACILLWMQGGPSQFETFSPLPGHANGGETKAIPTAVPGIQVAENFPAVAQALKDLAILRTVTSKEGAHPRATSLMQTGYLPTASVKYPALGAIVAQQLPRPGLDLPAFVRIGGARQNSTGGGLLGAEFDPFVMAAAGRPPANASPNTSGQRFERRLGLLENLEQGAALVDLRQQVADHQKLYRQAARMIQSPQMRAFDLDQEPAEVRAAYGSGQFGSGCLLARRLVEAGVPFVEVQLNGWDTHDNNFAQCRRLAGEVDGPFARLLADLGERGLLESTLVVWMGEFGRTPRINPRGGRDHFPRAFNVVLGGAGIRGGQVVGQVDRGGTAVADRPITVPDLFQTFCRALGINPAHENMSGIGRPIKIVEEGAAVGELFA